MALKTSSELTNQTVELIVNFQFGNLKPISTGIDHLDESLLGGLLPGTVLGLIGRSGAGKSYDAERIVRHILDTEKDVIIVSSNWELSHFKILVRDICQRTGKNMSEILFNTPTEEDLLKLKEICDIHRTENVLYQNEPVSPEVFAEDIESVIKQFPEKRIVCVIDNLENILITKGNQKESMDSLLYQVNRLKNMHPFISFVILNQMNQNYILRMDDIKKQKPIDSDIYGSDQLLKLCDVLYVKMQPYKLGIREKFMIFGKDFYPWLNEFKIYNDNGKTASFDPYGISYYFYLKMRNVADEKNIKDIFAERMFTREDSNYPIVDVTKMEVVKPIFMPVFDKETQPPPQTLTAAFGTSFQDNKDNDSPF